MGSNVTQPVNIGNPEELSIDEFARIVQELVGEDETNRRVVHAASPQDDPQRRRPDIRRAASLLGWEPRVKMQDGLKDTIDYFRKELQAEQEKLSRNGS